MTSVSVIDTVSNSLVASARVGTSPNIVAITPDGNRAYVTNSGDNSVSVIDTATNNVVTRVGVGSVPVGVAITRVALQTLEPTAPTNCSVMVVTCGNQATLSCDPVPIPNSLVLEARRNHTSQVPPPFQGVGVTGPMLPDGANGVYDAPIEPGDNEFEACDVAPSFVRACVWPVPSFGPDLEGCPGNPTPPQPLVPARRCIKEGCQPRNGRCFCQ
jgi:YVTN family beta-propeller protein